MPRHGGKGRCALRPQHDHVNLLRPAVIEQLLGRVALDHHRLRGHTALQLGRNHRQQLGFHLFRRPPGQNFVTILGPDHVLQNQPRALLGGQLRGILHHRMTGTLQACAAENRHDVGEPDRLRVAAGSRREDHHQGVARSDLTVRHKWRCGADRVEVTLRRHVEHGDPAQIQTVEQRQMIGIN